MFTTWVVVMRFCTTQDESARPLRCETIVEDRYDLTVVVVLLIDILRVHGKMNGGGRRFVFQQSASLFTVYSLARFRESKQKLFS